LYWLLVLGGLLLLLLAGAYTYLRSDETSRPVEEAEGTNIIAKIIAGVALGLMTAGAILVFSGYPGRPDPGNSPPDAHDRSRHLPP
jgi:hypothetical protein